VLNGAMSGNMKTTGLQQNIDDSSSFRTCSDVEEKSFDGNSDHEDNRMSATWKSKPALLQRAAHQDAIGDDHKATSRVTATSLQRMEAASAKDDRSKHYADDATIRGSESLCLPDDTSNMHPWSVLATARMNKDLTPSTISISGSSRMGTNLDVASDKLWISDGNGGKLDLVKLQKTQKRDSVFAFVKDTMFHRVKFLTNDRQLQWNFQSFAVPILDYVVGKDTSEKTRQNYWDHIKDNAKKALQERRATVNGSVKLAIVGKFRRQVFSCFGFCQKFL